MAINIEIKAVAHDFSAMIARAREISGDPGELILQEDIFFRTPKGRLKLRLLSPDRGQLVYYEREDSVGPKQSNYFLYPTEHPEALKSVLSKSLGVRGVVRKERWLFMAGDTRIHVDDVEGLGTFLELEVMLESGKFAERGRSTASALLIELGVQPGDLIAGAYIDLLEARQSGESGP